MPLCNVLDNPPRLRARDESVEPETVTRHSQAAAKSCLIIPIEGRVGCNDDHERSPNHALRQGATIEYGVAMRKRARIGAGVSCDSYGSSEEIARAEKRCDGIQHSVRHD